MKTKFFAYSNSGKDLYFPILTMKVAKTYEEAFALAKELCNGEGVFTENNIVIFEIEYDYDNSRLTVTINGESYFPDSGEERQLRKFCRNFGIAFLQKA